MLYFIPAWYQDGNWSEKEQFWYKRREKSEFDETIKLIQQMHRKNIMPFRMLLLAYSPNFRHFLHRQGLFRCSYWSCFDAIAQVEYVKMRVLSFHHLNWPEGVEFVYSSYAMIAFLNGEKYAKVEYGENGNFISIDLYKDGDVYRKNIYDDRGFVSSSDFFEDGIYKYKEYYMIDGTRKMREFIEDGHVEINPNVPYYTIEFEGKSEIIQFEKIIYSDIEEVISEVFCSYLCKTSSNDTFCVGMHTRHISLLNKCLQGRKYIATFFENRFEGDYIDENITFMDNSSYIVTDTKQRKDEIVASLNRSTLKIRDISPYDTRLDLGKSNQLKVLNILVPIDGLSKDVFNTMIKECAQYLQKNDKAMIHLLTKRTTKKAVDDIYSEVRDVLKEIDISEDWSLNVDEEYVRMIKSDIEILHDSNQRFFVDVCVEEVSISKCLSVQRVILDLRNVEDVFLYVSAISKGIPRIGIHEDKYLEKNVNGLIIKELSEIGNALSYYLDNFEKWNEALIGCYEVGQKYTTDILIDSWKEVLKTVE